MSHRTRPKERTRSDLRSKVRKGRCVVHSSFPGMSSRFLVSTEQCERSTASLGLPHPDPERSCPYKKNTTAANQHPTNIREFYDHKAEIAAKKSRDFLSAPPWMLNGLFSATSAPRYARERCSSHVQDIHTWNQTKDALPVQVSPAPFHAF